MSTYVFIYPKQIIRKEGVCAQSRFYFLEAYLKKVAYLHDYILSAPFYKYLKALQSGTTSSLYPKIMSFYSHEPM